MSKENAFSLDFMELQQYQANRYPFLLIDYVTEVIPGKRAVGYKNLTNNEWFFPRHFEGHPIMPGALQMEAVGQMLTVAITTLPGLAGYAAQVMQYSARFRKEVFPGSRFDIETEVTSWRHGICKGRGRGLVNGDLACEAEMILTIPEILKNSLPARK